MKVQILNEYQLLAQENFFKPILCYNGEHEQPLYCEYDMESDTITMCCLECNYRLKPGFALYDAVLKRLKEYHDKQQG